MKKTLVLASNNPKKVHEFNALFQPLGFSIKAQSQWNVPPCAEPHATFVENAIAKARHASVYTNLPALADDSGLCVDALNGAPGVHSARFATHFGFEKSDAKNNLCLLEQLKQETHRRAFYYCVLVYVRCAEDPIPIIVEGAWQGEILSQLQGTNGFGYDPLFYIPELKQSAAQLDPVVKNTFSHRAKALIQLMEKLKIHDHIDFS